MLFRRLPLRAWGVTWSINGTRVRTALKRCGDVHVVDVVIQRSENSLTNKSAGGE